MDDASGLAPGARLGKYLLEGLLGRGGMGEVWAAHDPDLDRRVALKVLRPSAASTEEAHVRLLREGRAMARLRHPNVITVYEATSAAGRDVIAMELIDGKSLAGWLAEHREPDAIVAAMIAAGRGLAAAHAAGMVHRDFKPHNVLVDRDGRVVVTDFGLARALGDAAPDATAVDAPAAAAPAVDAPVGPDAPPTPAELAVAETLAERAAPAVDETADARGPARSGATPPTGRGATRSSRAGGDRAALHSTLTRTGALLGTPAYMAPELLDGAAADARSDQFAFCVAAWEALAGTRPFAGTTLVELRDAVVAGKTGGADKVPARLRPILARGLAADPGERWPAMDPLLRALDAAWRRPRRIAIAAIGGAVAIAAIAVPVALALRPAAIAGACPPVAVAFAPATAPAIEANIRTIAGGGPPGQRAVAYLERWRGSWRETYAATCKASKHAEFLARRSCLDTMRDRLIDLLEMSADAPPELLASTDAVAILPLPDACLARPRAVAPPPPADPAVRAETQRISSALIRYRLGPHGRPEQVAALDELVAAARATHYDPLIADALLVKGDTMVRFDPAAACTAHGEAATVAERAGADASRINAMMGLIECVQRVPGRSGETDALFERTGGLIDRLGDRAKRAHLDTMRAAMLGVRGDWDAAIELADAAHTGWLAVGAPVNAARATVVEAQARLARAHGDDLRRAETVLRAALDTVAKEAPRANEQLRGTLADVLWAAGRLDEAVAMMAAFAQPAPDDAAIAVVVRVVDADGEPADGAEVLAAIDPVGDPVRLVRLESLPTVVARADATGVARMTVQAGALIVARKAEQLGAIEAPARGGEVRITMRPQAYVAGTITAPAGPAPAEPRATPHGVATGSVIITVGAHAWAMTAPVDATGRFRVAVLPGRVVIAAGAETRLGDTLGASVVRDLAAGPTAVELVLPRPVSLRVIARPAIDGVIVVVPGARAVKPRDVEGLLTAGPGFALAPTTEPVTRAAAKDDLRLGDAVIEMSAPGPGPITVCAVGGADWRWWSPIPGLVVGKDPVVAAAAVACVTAAAVDGVVTTVVVPTTR